MPFEVTISSGCWCSVLGSDLCTSYSDLFVPVDWLNLIKFEWIVDSVVLKVQWLFYSVVSEVQRFQWLIVLVIAEIDDWVSAISEIDWVGWCKCIWWLYCSGNWFWASMLLMSPVWKLDETWPTYSVVVYQEYHSVKIYETWSLEDTEGWSLQCYETSSRKDRKDRSTP